MPQTVDIHQDFAKSVEDLFAELSDHEKLGRILGTPMKRIVDGTGAGGKNGVGSVRRVGGGVAAFDETITELVPNERIEYRVTKGGPIKNHLGRMTFSKAENGGSRLDWVITFESKVPFAGPLIAAALGGAVRRSLAKHAKR